jgi:Tol biopolymer transport system component
LACAERNGNFDIYTIPVDGGRKKRLTISDGLDDGPDYSDGSIYLF